MARRTNGNSQERRIKISLRGNVQRSATRGAILPGPAIGRMLSGGFVAPLAIGRGHGYDNALLKSFRPGCERRRLGLPARHFTSPSRTSDEACEAFVVAQ